MAGDAYKIGVEYNPGDAVSLPTTIQRRQDPVLPQRFESVAVSPAEKLGIVGKPPTLTERESLAAIKLQQAKLDAFQQRTRADLATAEYMRRQRELLDDRAAKLTRILEGAMTEMETPPPQPVQRSLDLGQLLAMLAGGLAGGELGLGMNRQALEDAERRRLETNEANRLAWEHKVKTAGLKYDTALRRLLGTEDRQAKLDDAELASLMQEAMEGRRLAERLTEMEIGQDFQREMVDFQNSYERWVKEQERAGLPLDTIKSTASTLMSNLFNPGSTKEERQAAIAMLEGYGLSIPQAVRQMAQRDGTLAESRQVTTAMNLQKLPYVGRQAELDVKLAEERLKNLGVERTLMESIRERNLWSIQEGKYDVALGWSRFLMDLENSKGKTGEQAIQDMEMALIAARQDKALYRERFKAGLRALGYNENSLRDMLSGRLDQDIPAEVMQWYQMYLDATAREAKVSKTIEYLKTLKPSRVDPAAINGIVGNLSQDTGIQPLNPFASGVGLKGAGLSGPIGGPPNSGRRGTR